MTITLGFFTDSGLTTPLATLSAVQSDDGTAAAVNRVVYLGSIASGKKFQAASNPGVDQVQVQIVDADIAAGVEAAHIKLATSFAGLDSAVSGAPLSVGTQRLSGPANALAVHVRIDTPALAQGTYTDAALTTNTLIEVDV